MPAARLCFRIPLAVALASLAALAAAGSADWLTETGVSATRFCEGLRDGPVKQPANTWSNVGFYVVGLLIGAQASRDVAARKAATWSNPLVTTVFYPASAAVSSVLVGAGSVALHASTTRWGADLDLFFLHSWGAWMVAYAAARLLRRGDACFLAVWGALSLVAALRGPMGERFPVQGSTLFGALVAAAIGVELVGKWRNRRRSRADDRYLAWAIVVFLAAYACYLASGAEGPWCEPASLWQGHAAWHLLCAGATAMVYLYGRSERRLASRDDTATPAGAR